MTDDPQARAAALASYGILDTAPEREFDDLVSLAARICGVPISLVSLLDVDRQWFKAEVGLGARETEIESAFCAHAVAAGVEVFEVPDATADDRFAGNRLVLGDPNIRFYAGAPMRTADGTPLGTVCVIDRVPRRLDAGQREALEMLARQAVALLEARRATAELAVEARRREVALSEASTAAGRFQAAFAHSPVGMLLCDAAGQVVEANDAFAAMLGRSCQDLSGISASSLTDPGDLAAEAELLAEVLAGTRDNAVRERIYRHRDGRSVRAVSHTAVLRGPAGILTGFLSQVQSIEERLRAEDALLETQSAHDAIIGIDATGRIIAWNAGAERLFGRAAATAIGQSVSMIFPQRWQSAHAEGLARVSNGGPPRRLAGQTVQLAALRADGSEFPVELSLSSWHRGGQTYYTAIVRDVSEREALHAAMLAQANTDPLTGLPNRGGLTAALAGLLADPTKTPVSVITVDLDGFTQINASLGPAGGDRVLTRVGRLLPAALRPDQVVARAGGDEFAVLLPNTGPAAALRVAQRLTEALRDAPITRAAPVQLEICAGVATVHRPVGPAQARRSAATALRNATLALADARTAGPRSIRAYRPVLVTSARRRSSLHAALQQAIGDGQLTLAYQPQVQLSTGQVRAVEALARWNHPRLGQIGPNEFIPLAEDTGLMPALGAWALMEACERAAHWHDSHQIGISVNVSGRQLASDDILGHVEHALLTSGLPPAALTVEITESVLIANPARVARRLGVLKQLGVRVAVDDFGTGYSSLSSLTNFPVDELKIDRAFVAPLPHDNSALRIATAVAALADGLGLDTVAEGIETADQARVLLALGCTLGQGYLYARPVPADDIPAILTAKPARLTVVGSERVGAVAAGHERASVGAAAYAHQAAVAEVLRTNRG